MKKYTFAQYKAIVRFAKEINIPVGHALGATPLEAVGHVFSETRHIPEGVRLSLECDCDGAYFSYGSLYFPNMETIASDFWTDAKHIYLPKDIKADREELAKKLSKTEIIYVEKGSEPTFCRFNTEYSTDSRDEEILAYITEENFYPMQDFAVEHGLNVFEAFGLAFIRYNAIEGGLYDFNQLTSIPNGFSPYASFINLENLRVIPENCRPRTLGLTLRNIPEWPKKFSPQCHYLTIHGLTELPECLDLSEVQCPVKLPAIE